MFIQNPVWKSVPAYLLEAPVWEGTVLTENGEIVWDSSTGGGSDSATQIQSVGPANMLRSSAPAQEPYGIVPETIYVFPPTMLINVAVGGTIDLTLPGNEAMENFPEDLADELGADFNFVRHNEHTGGSGGGSGVMYFDITTEGTFPDTHLVSSKTFTEIMSAISAGIVPIAKYRFVNDNNTVLLTLVDYSDTLLMFSSIEKDPDENHAVNLLSLKILSTNDVEVDTVHLSTISPT